MVSLYYIGASVVQIALALYFATVLSFNTRFRNLFKGILFFPYLINGVAIGMIFLYFFQPGGTLDSALSAARPRTARRHQWLGDPDIVNFSLAGTSVWRYLGLNFVLFLGAIQSIPAQLYEAAELDGANRWQQFRYIILPGIRPIIGLSFILAISGSLAVFEIPFIMTGGANGSETFVIQTVKHGLQVPQGRPRLGDGRRPAADHPAGHLDPAPARARGEGRGDRRRERRCRMRPARDSQPVAGSRARRHRLKYVSLVGQRW